MEKDGPTEREKGSKIVDPALSFSGKLTDTDQRLVTNSYLEMRMVNSSLFQIVLYSGNICSLKRVIFTQQIKSTLTFK